MQRNKNCTYCGIFIILLMILSSSVGYAQNNSYNYITESQFLSESGLDSIETVTYYDGLGRALQTVRRDASPSGGDLMDWVAYDACGREQCHWLPAHASGNGGNIKLLTPFTQLAITDYNDQRPYRWTTYDETPLDRVRRVSDPGMAWQAEGKNTHYQYLTSHPSQEVSRSTKYHIMFVSSMIVISRTGYGAVGEHEVLKTEDEDGRVLRVFRDMNGRTVQEVREVPAGNTTQYHITSYVYDEAGRLSGVLPPLLTCTLTGGSSWSSYNKPAITDYGYFYRYDNRGRLIAKKLPGIDWIYYIYDKSDRLVLSQDGVQRQAGKWAFRVEDALGRECLTGLCAGSYDAFSSPLNSANVKAVRDSSGAYYGYRVEGVTLNNADVLTVSWWDDYSFLGKYGIPPADSASVRYDIPETGYGAQYSICSHGFRTGALTKVLGITSGNPYLWEVLRYDEKGRVVQYKHSTHVGGVDKEYFGYDFIGHQTKHRIVHSPNTGEVLTECYTYTFDNWGRPQLSFHSLNNGNPIAISDAVYDAVGRLVQNRRNGAQGLDTRYVYNVRGWLTSLEVGGNSVQDDPLFAEDLYYNTANPTGNSQLQWGGNISGLVWQVGGEDKTRGYSFSYDPLSRLTQAGYWEEVGTSGTYNRSYSYDRHGNMLSAVGSGVSQSFTYSGNQLVSETVGGTTIGHTYDQNGRLSADVNNWNYHYNDIGLPSAKAGSGGVTTWAYAANGTKLRRAVPYPTAACTDYVGNLIYENDVLDKILIEGGYIAVGGTSENPVYSYRFFVPDHQGNIRVVADSVGTALQVNHYDPYGNDLGIVSSAVSQSSPLVTGTEASQYKYSGNEWDDRMDMYDFSARMYKPSIHRFTAMDPYCEKYYSISPYAYCAGNPVNLVDPQGDTLKVAAGSSSSFVRNVKTAKSIMRIMGLSEYWIKLENSPQLFVLQESTGGNSFSYYDQSGGVISWNPHRVGQDDESLVKRSPFTGLGHEMGHAVDYEEAVTNGQYEEYKQSGHKDENNPYGNSHDEHVIQNHEQVIARGLLEIGQNQTTREKHTNTKGYSKSYPNTPALFLWMYTVLYNRLINN